jgi:hypothetical protein
VVTRVRSPRRSLPAVTAIHDASRVASELGRTSPQMLYSTYRELVLPEEAERYLEAYPAEEAANIVPMTMPGRGQK